jgi:hypothetical protein
MTTEAEAAIWARSEFGHATLGNTSRTKRLVAIARAVALRPDGKVTSVFTKAADREGAFRFVENDLIEPREMLRSAHLAAARRCLSETYAFVPMDGTSLNLTDLAKRKGFGAVGRGCDSSMGLQVMTAIAVTPDGTPQGLTGQVYWSRRRRRKKRPQERDKQTVAQKETQRWIDVMTSTCQAFAQEAPMTTPWFQGDRGGDAWPILEAASQLGAEVTIRACWDRRLVTDEGKPQRYLWETIEDQEPLGDYLLLVPARPQRPARVARMQLRACAVTLDIRDKRTRKRSPFALWAVQAKEVDAPRGHKPIDWMLLTTHPVRGIQEAQVVVFGYSQRWRIEDFHNTWKSGACGVESTQLRSVDNVLRWATILASVSVRIQRLIHLSRTEPDQPATVEFTQPEIDAVIAVRKPKGVRQGDVPPIVDVVRWIADEGGYTGKSSGGPPGARVLARGMERMQVIFRFFTEQAKGERKK